MRQCLSLVALAPFAQVAFAADVVRVAPVTDRIVMIHFNEGHVQIHKIGQKRSDDVVVIDPLDISRATQTSSYEISSKDDKGFSVGLTPTRIGRKSKGTDYAWYVDAWENDRAVNKRPDHTKEHWVYLNLSKPLQPGKTYTLSTGSLAKNGKSFSFKFDHSARSESVHVNSLGYSPRAPQKFGYVYHWAGDLGGIKFDSYLNQPFFVLNRNDGKAAFQGKIAFRKRFDNQETNQLGDAPPSGNYLRTDVYECDFSALNTPGEYVLYVPGIGGSWPFKIDDNVLFDAYFHTARALYHNRSGIELKEPFTKFARPAPHNPNLTPGFKNKLVYSTVRIQDYNIEDTSEATRKKLEAGIKGPLSDAWGWYQDAGDWDSYFTHLNVAQHLLFAYQSAPKAFTDGQLNLPESGNGLPDILDEAAWLPRFCYRLRHELLKKGWGTGGVSLRVSGDQFGGDGEGVPSWKDVNRLWVVSGEDSASTYRYAGTAAHLALLMKQNGFTDPQKVDWTKEAVESYRWAEKNERSSEKESYKDHKAYAAAALYLLTDEKRYESDLIVNTESISATSTLAYEVLYAPMLIGLSDQKTEVAKRLRGAVLSSAKKNGIESANRRALRWGGLFDMPMLIGQQTTPMCLEVPIGAVIAKKHEPSIYQQLVAASYTTADYFLGTNSLNMTWITGVGPRFPTHIFHMDSWYRGAYHPGLIPYSPWVKQAEFGNGPWSQFWAYKTIYPASIDLWPGNEQWFSNRCSPLGSEFTVHQNIGPAAAFYAILLHLGG